MIFFFKRSPAIMHLTYHPNIASSGFAILRTVTNRKVAEATIIA